MIIIIYFFNANDCFNVNSNLLNIKNFISLLTLRIAVITVTSGLDTQTRVMGHFPLY